MKREETMFAHSVSFANNYYLISRKKKEFNIFFLSLSTGGNTFASLSSLKKHAKGVHEGHTQTCTICSKTFSINASMKEHIDTVHNGLTNYRCDICGKKFGRPSHLGRHKRTIHNIHIRKIIIPTDTKPELDEEFIEPID